MPRDTQGLRALAHFFLHYSAGGGQECVCWQRIREGLTEAEA